MIFDNIASAVVAPDKAGCVIIRAVIRPTAPPCLSSAGLFLEIKSSASSYKLDMKIYLN